LIAGLIHFAQLKNSFWILMPNTLLKRSGSSKLPPATMEICVDRIGNFQKQADLFMQRAEPFHLCLYASARFVDLRVMDVAEK
jgi:hypothetical protein